MYFLKCRCSTKQLGLSLAHVCTATDMRRKKRLLISDDADRYFRCGNAVQAPEAVGGGTTAAGGRGGVAPDADAPGRGSESNRVVCRPGWL